MKDYSKVSGNVCYKDCENCIFTFGENKECMECNYYESCMVEKEIDEFELAQDRALERFYDRMENEEYPSFIMKIISIFIGDNMSEIEEIRKTIKKFADEGQYSVNNPYVKSLYARLRELEGREKMVEEVFEDRFIDDSDVPIDGRYE